MSREESHLDISGNKAGHFINFTSSSGSFTCTHSVSLSHAGKRVSFTFLLYVSSSGLCCPHKVTRESWPNIPGDVSRVSLSNLITLKVALISFGYKNQFCTDVARAPSYRPFATVLSTHVDDRKQAAPLLLQLPSSLYETASIKVNGL